MDWRPMVSVVMPMYQEREAIEECLAGFEAQTWPEDLMEVVVADGGSTDGCRELVEEMARTRPWLRLVDNPARRIPAGCNVLLAEARGEVICYFSAHGLPSPTYVERVVAVLAETGAAGVGGTYLHVGTDPRATAIGMAMASPFGMASGHRFANERREVDTISHAAYRTDALRSVGGFDETMRRNEDYEVNWRLRQAGGVLVFDPSIVSTYRPRGSLARLRRQFFWYGVYKARMLQAHPGSVRPRHLVPPVAVAAGAALAVLAPWSRSARRLAALAGLGYVGLVGAAVAVARPARHDADPLVFAAALPVMHGSWGAGFLLSPTGIEAP